MFVILGRRRMRCLRGLLEGVLGWREEVEDDGEG